MAILLGVKRYLIKVLNCISKVTDEAKGLSVCWLACCRASLKKHVFKCFAHFFNWVVCLFVVELCKGSV